jgi:hypothetical protein
MSRRTWSLLISVVVIVASLTWGVLSAARDPGAPEPPPGNASSRSPTLPGGVPEARACEKPEGPLEEIAVDSYVSEGGLSYLPDPGRFASRADHVLAHTADDLSRPLHGVFDLPSNACDVFDLLDEVRRKIQNGAAVTCGDGCFDVDMHRDVGSVGGTQGASAGNPHTTWVRIVLAHGDDVITAYPILP